MLAGIRTLLLRCGMLGLIAGISTGVAWAQTPEARLSLQLEFKLPGDNAVIFGGVRDVALGPDGSILVLDGLNKTIYRFRADGVLADSLGRAGRGPGELVQPTEIAVGPGGEIAVADGANGRVTFRGRDGRVTGSTTITGWPTGLWWNESGLYLKTATTSAFANTVSFFRLSPQMETTPPPTLQFTFERDPRTLAMRGLSCDLCPAAVGPRGEIVLADPDPVAYRMVQVRGDGSAVRVWERAGLPPVRFTQSELDAIRAGLNRVGLPFSLDRHRYRPRLAGVAIDNEGRLWVLRRVSGGAPPRLDVFGPDGQFAFEIPTPPGTEEMLVRNGLLVTVGEDAEGAPTVLVHRIER